jgi:Uma2 family endonuclease
MKKHYVLQISKNLLLFINQKPYFCLKQCDMYFEPQELLSAIIENTMAPSILAKAQTILSEEQRRRENFYADIDDSMKVEFINGEIVVHSPAKKKHVDAIGNLFKLVDTYVHLEDFGYVGCEKILTAFTRNDYGPDMVFFNIGVAKTFNEDQWKFPVPDFIVEVISKSTEEKDRGVKFQDYETHGVKEYWIIDASTHFVEQYILEENKFSLKLKAKDGHIESSVIEGFVIDIRAIFVKSENIKELKRVVKEKN